jgi:predicted RNase H-like HicB family nuclease
METKMNFTAVFEQVKEGYIATIEEIPGVNTQGATLEEARLNLVEALEMVLAVRRELAEEEMAGKTIIKEPIRIVA